MSRAARSRGQKISIDGETLLNRIGQNLIGRLKSRRVHEAYGIRGERRRLGSGAYRAPQPERGRSGTSRRRRGREKGGAGAGKEGVA